LFKKKKAGENVEQELNYKVHYFNAFRNLLLNSIELLSKYIYIYIYIINLILWQNDSKHEYTFIHVIIQQL